MFLGVWPAWGRIDLLCAHTGVVDKSSGYIYSHRKRKVEEIPPAPGLICTDIDYKGVIYGIHLATHCTRHNRPEAWGEIIVNASIGGVLPHRTYSEYCGAKEAVLQCVQGVAPLLKAKEHILFNAVLPGVVATRIVPPQMIATISPECLIPISSILGAHDRFINDGSGIAGEILEAWADELILYHPPQYGNGRETKRAITVWGTSSRDMHGEHSGLENAVLWHGIYFKFKTIEN